MKWVLVSLVVSCGAWAECWTVSGATFCDNRESISQRPSSASVPAGPTAAEIEAQEAGVRRAKANALREEGLAAWKRGEWGIAEEQFQQALAWNPDSKAILQDLLNARHKVGLIALDEGDWEYAATTFSSLLYLQPGSAEYQRLSALAETKRQAARQAYELNRQGIKAAEGGDWRGAVRAFQQAAQFDARKPQYAANLAAAQQQQEAFDSNDRGRAAAQSGDWASALGWFEKAAKIDPSESAYSTNIALARRKIQDQQDTARVQQGLDVIARDVKNTAAPAGGLSLGDLGDDAFGTTKAHPQLTPVEKGSVGRDTTPGAQLKSGARHGGETAGQDTESASKTAQKSFDISGTQSGNLIAIDKSRQGPPSALDAQIPKGARDDQEIQRLQTWYRSLDVQKAEKEQLIVELEKKKDPLVAVKRATLANDIKRLVENQAIATKSAKARVEVVKKEMLDKGLEWDEAPSVELPKADKKKE